MSVDRNDDVTVWTAVFHTGGNSTPVNCAAWVDAAMDLVPTGLATATDTGSTVSTQSQRMPESLVVAASKQVFAVKHRSGPAFSC